MKVTDVTFEMMVNTGNFEHKSASVTVELEENDTPHDAMKRAQEFVKRELAPRPDKTQWDNAKRILSNPKAYTGYEVEKAQEIAKLYEEPEDLQF